MHRQGISRSSQAATGPASSPSGPGIQRRPAVQPPAASLCSFCLPSLGPKSPRSRGLCNRAIKARKGGQRKGRGENLMRPQRWDALPPSPSAGSRVGNGKKKEKWRIAFSCAPVSLFPQLPTQLQAYQITVPICTGAIPSPALAPPMLSFPPS